MRSEPSRNEVMRNDPLRRDPAIDFIRGAGILMIGVDHLAYLAEKFGSPDFVNPFVTWLRVGWSSAAEFFVFFSGYLTGIVYLKTMQSHGVAMMWARAAQRSWHIYVLNLLTLCAVLLLLGAPQFLSEQLNQLSGMDALLEGNAAVNLTSFLTLRYEPLFFEILNLYIVLLLLAPAIVLLTRLNAFVTLALSFAVWLTVQLNAAYAIAPAFGTTGNFNPNGWQFVFVLGMLSSIHEVFSWLRRAWSRERLLIVSGTLLAAAFLIKMIDRGGWSLPLIGAFDMPGYDKVNLGPLQLVHFLVSVVFVMQVVPQSQAMQNTLPMRAVAGVGRRSLECFCLSTVMVYAAVAWLARNTRFDPLSVLIAGAAIVILLCVLAPVVDWIEAKPWRAKRREPPVSAPASAALSLRNVP